MRFVLPLLVCMLSGFSAPQVFAGDWSGGGGGEILEHAVNPWFLENTKSVSYCILAGEDFEQSADELDAMVRDAFRFWHFEFLAAYSPLNKIYEGGQETSIQVRLRTDHFVRRSCGEVNAVDLAFQFGALNEEQVSYFTERQMDVARFVALSIRTDYDRVNLKAKGFIYVSPDRGPRRFRGEDVSEHAWTADDGLALRKVLMHELGHTFGIAHFGERRDLMSANFPEYAVSKEAKEGYGLYGSGSFFHPGDFSGDANLTHHPDHPFADVYKFFGIPKEHLVIKIKGSLEALAVYAKPREDMPWTKTGEVRFATTGQRRYLETVTLWLPEEQKVYPGVAKRKVLHGPQRVQVQNNGIFRSQSGVVRPLFIQHDAQSLQIGGEISGALDPDILNNDDGNFIFGSGWHAADEFKQQQAHRR